MKDVTIGCQKNKLIEYIKQRGPNEAIIYLLSGLSNECNYDGRMTPQLFFSEFLISGDEEQERRHSEVLKDLFADPDHNMLCFMADAGSGKSTFVNTLDLRANITRGSFSYTPLDCARGEKTIRKNDFPTTALRQRFRKLYRSMILGPETQLLFYKEVLLQITSLDIADNDQDFVETFKEQIAESIGKLIADDKPIIDLFKSYSVRTEDAIVHAHTYVQLAMYLLLIACVKCYSSTNRKEIVIVDNLEAYSHQTSHRVCTYFGDMIVFLEKLFDQLNLACANKSIYGKTFTINFMRDFTFVFCIRTTTNLEISSVHQQGKGELWGHNDKYKIYREFFDFCPEALLVKLKFLDANNITGAFRDEVYKIISLLIPPSKIDRYLRCGEFNQSEEVKVFTSKTYLPFFNNNFRNAISVLSSLYDTKEGNQPWMNVVRSLAESRMDYDIEINAARMIIFRAIFDLYIRKSYFADFGIQMLSGKNEHSLARIILMYLYWQEAIVGNHSAYSGESLSEIHAYFSQMYVEDEIIDTIIKLSMYYPKDDRKMYAVNDWAPFVTFGDGVDNFETCESLKLGDRTNKRIKLTCTGRCYCEFFSLQFEFFSARSQVFQKPLFFYDFINTVNITDIGNIIDDVYQSVNHFLLGVFERTTCANERRYCSLNSHYKCAQFIGAQSVFGVLSEQINYVDRYRTYILKGGKCTNLHDTNSFLLEKIEKFLVLFCEARRRICLCVKDVNSLYTQTLKTKVFKSYYGKHFSRESLAEIIRKMIDNEYYGRVFDYMEMDG